ncbi:phage head closure protein [Aeromonas allosaccharophila]|nr:phage head closure protein [Aeromonas allosaccharophila]MBS4698083.1 phage head closure protein [Aeromonas allosaccharophila]
MNKRVTILEREQGTNDWGEPVEVWTPVITCWANVRYLTGRELIEGGIQFSEQTITVVMDFSASVLPKHYLEADGKRFSIQAVAPDATDRFMNVTAKQYIQ